MVLSMVVRSAQNHGSSEDVGERVTEPGGGIKNEISLESLCSHEWIHSVDPYLTPNRCCYLRIILECCQKKCVE